MDTFIVVSCLDKQWLMCCASEMEAGAWKAASMEVQYSVVKAMILFEAALSQ